MEFYTPKLEAFALSGRIIIGLQDPGRCPGLGASALSGRVGQTCFRMDNPRQDEDSGSS